MRPLGHTQLSKKIGILLLVLLSLNMASLFFFDREVSRYVRLVSIIVFVICMSVHRIPKKNLIIYLAVAIVLRQVSLLYYELSLGFIFYVVFGIICYAIICFERAAIIKQIRLSPVYIILIITILVGNFLAIYVLSKNIETVALHQFNPALFWVYGVFLIISIIISFLYNVYFNSTRSLLFMYTIMAFFIADVSSLLEYYLDLYVLSYVEVICYFLAFGLYIIFTLNRKIEKEEKEQLKLLGLPY